MPKAEAQNAFPRRARRGTVLLLVSPPLSEGSDTSYIWGQCLKSFRPLAVCSGGSGFQVCSLGTSCVTSLFLKRGRGKGKGKSPKCKTCDRMPYSVLTTRPAWVGCRVVSFKIFRRYPQVLVSADMGEEGELTPETERQMVRGEG